MPAGPCPASTASASAASPRATLPGLPEDSPVQILELPRLPEAFEKVIESLHGWIERQMDSHHAKLEKLDHYVKKLDKKTKELDAKMTVHDVKLASLRQFCHEANLTLQLSPFVSGVSGTSGSSGVHGSAVPTVSVTAPPAPPAPPAAPTYPETWGVVGVSHTGRPDPAPVPQRLPGTVPPAPPAPPAPPTPPAPPAPPGVIRLGRPLIESAPPAAGAMSSELGVVVRMIRAGDGPWEVDSNRRGG